MIHAVKMPKVNVNFIFPVEAFKFSKVHGNEAKHEKRYFQ